MHLTAADGTTREIRGVLFDMDGTIVDSTPATMRTWQRWAEHNGVADRLTILHGQPAMATVQLCFPDATSDELLRLCAEQTMSEREDLEDVVAMPGALDLVEWLDRHDIPWAVVTSADLPLARARLTKSGFAPRHLVTCDDITHGKPHPEPFLLGAHTLGIPITQCLVVEDAPAGVEAGLASGAVTAALNGLVADLTITDVSHLHTLLRHSTDR